eukprot:2401095-Prymnesium_polylepis.1
MGRTNTKVRATPPKQKHLQQRRHTPQGLGTGHSTLANSPAAPLSRRRPQETAGRGKRRSMADGRSTQTRETRGAT